MFCWFCHDAAHFKSQICRYTNTFLETGIGSLAVMSLNRRVYPFLYMSYRKSRSITTHSKIAVVKVYWRLYQHQSTGNNSSTIYHYGLAESYNPWSTATLCSTNSIDNTGRDFSIILSDGFLSSSSFLWQWL